LNFIKFRNWFESFWSQNEKDKKENRKNRKRERRKKMEKAAGGTIPT
jgi:hypothetical protein